MNTPKELLDDFIKKTEEKSDLTAEMNGTFQYDFSADNNGKWYVTFDNGNVTYGEGEAPDAGVTIIAKFKNFVDFYNGKLNAMAAVMTGKLKIKGNMAEAMKMQKFL
ncbi:MAG: SCP2 sterol-binding domain-containing protein [Desulfitobacterium sp.]|nr:SCP2 sterol-binding domain-containing protein [Desulfitobacterium sp.]